MYAQGWRAGELKEKRCPIWLKHLHSFSGVREEYLSSVDPGTKGVFLHFHEARGSFSRTPFLSPPAFSAKIVPAGAVSTPALSVVNLVVWFDCLRRDLVTCVGRSQKC